MKQMIKVFFEPAELEIFNTLAEEMGRDRSPLIRELALAGLRQHERSCVPLVRDPIAQKQLQFTMNTLALVVELSTRQGIDVAAAKATAAEAAAVLMGQST